jgi:hypothetical protein
MIMYRNGIPLIPAEELGYHLGLTVAPEDGRLFYDARESEAPSAAGYGTQIYNPKYEPNKIFKQLDIPLRFTQKLAAELPDKKTLLNELRHIEKNDSDALLCFNHGVIRGKYEPNSGHVVVFDKLIDGKVRIVDASWLQPKWRVVEPSLLLDVIKRHGNVSSGGIWHFART